MSKLEELIQELCPNGVNFKRIDSVTKVLRGKRLTKKELVENGEYPVFHGGLEPLGFYNQYNRDSETTMIINVGASAGTVGFCSKRFWSSDGCFCIENSPILDSKFIYLYLSSKEKDFISKVRHAGIPTLDKNVIEGYLIPVPPLEVQKEIVRLLDEFIAKTTELQDKLNEELEARKKQYEYYRETVLNDNLDSMTVKIGDVADLKAGATPKTSNPEFWENGTIPWMSSGEVNQGKVTYTEKKITELGYNSSSTKMLPSETVVIALAGQGKTRGTVAITQIPLCTNQSLCGICAKDELNSMYLYHYLKSRYEDLRAISNGDGTRGGLNLKMIANYDIPLPPLEVQMKIVNILDKLDSINNDMYSSINNEIESRQKQYEFYRDKLLTFKELNESEVN